VTKADTDVPTHVPHLNRRIHPGIRLSVPRVEGVPLAQVLHWLTETRKRQPSGSQAGGLTPVADGTIHGGSSSKDYTLLSIEAGIK
jgi:hypothetical protein